MRLRVTQYGEPILRESGQNITEFDDALVRFAENMTETMYAEEGIGLAAQQVGRAVRLCVIDVRPPEGAEVPFNYRFDDRQPPLDLFMPIALCNPEVEIIDKTEDIYEEGCLSFPDVRGKITRPSGVRCQFQDINGNPHVIEADGLLGRCILHEVDHLNGVLFIDLMDKRDLRKNEARLKKLKRASRDYLKSLK
jgi:peptide deformylase